MVLYNTFQSNTPVASTNVLDGVEAARLRQANLDAYLAATATAPRPMPQTGTGAPPVVTNFDKAGTEAGTRMNSVIDQGVSNVRTVGSWGAGNQDAINQQVNAGIAQQYGQMAGLGQRAMGDTTDGSVANELAYQQQALASIGRIGGTYSDQMKQMSDFNAQSAEQAMNSSRQYNASAIEDQMNAGKRAAADAAAAAAKAKANDPFSVANMRAMKWILEQKQGKQDPKDFLLSQYSHKSLKRNPNVWVEKVKADKKTKDPKTGKMVYKMVERAVDKPPQSRIDDKSVYHPAVEKDGKYKEFNQTFADLRELSHPEALNNPKAVGHLKTLEARYGKKWTPDELTTFKEKGHRTGNKQYYVQGNEGGKNGKLGQIYSYATGKPISKTEGFKTPRIRQMIAEYSKARTKYNQTPDITFEDIINGIQEQIDAG